jgi:hypothetical protein
LIADFWVKTLKSKAMKKSILVTFLIAMLFQLGALAQSSDDTTEFKDFFQGYFKSYNQNAAETLRKGCVSDYQMMGGDGILRTLEATCKMFSGLKSSYGRLEDEKYRVYGNTGVVTGTTYWGYVPVNGNKYDGKALFTYVFTKTPAGWKQVSGHHIDLK